MPILCPQLKRNLGFVAIYFANLEDELDELIKLSDGVFVLPEKIQRWKFRDKAEWIQKQFRKRFATHKYRYSDQEGPRVDRVLAACRRAALKRNEILHRPIFGDLKGGAVQKDISGKMRPLDIAKIYQFAEYVFELSGAVYGLRFQLGRLSQAAPR